MKLWDIVRSVGSSVVREVVPGGGILVDAVNQFLPPGQKLPNDATGQDIGTAVSKLPPEQQAEVMGKEFDVDMARIRQTNETVRAMLEMDTKNPQTTRPYIAKGAFHVIAFAVVLVVATWSFGVFKGDEGIIAAVTQGWPFILSVVGPFVVLLHAYFGVIRTEHKQRLDAAVGRVEPSSIAGVLANLIKRK